MKTYNIHEAKTNLSHLIALSQSGEEVIICKAGKPIASLSPIKEKAKKRKFGEYEGQVWMDSDSSWEKLDEEVAEMFAESFDEKL